MQKRASYKEVYQLYKRAYSWDEFKNDASKAWKGFNDYADKNQWVRPTLYGLGGAGLGFGVGSISKNPLWRILLAILGGAGGALGGFKHNYSRLPYDNVDNTPQDPLGIDAAQGAVEGQEADQRAANEATMKADTETAPKTTTAKPAEKTLGISDPVYRKALFGKPLIQQVKDNASKPAAKSTSKPSSQSARYDQDARGAVQQQAADERAANEADMRARANQPQWVDGAPDWYTNSPHRTRFQNNMFGNNRDGNPNNPVKSLTFDEANFARKANILDKLLQMRRVKMNPYSN